MSSFVPAGALPGDPSSPGLDSPRSAGQGAPHVRGPGSNGFGIFCPPREMGLVVFVRSCWPPHYLPRAPGASEIDSG
eukprot:7045110-Pyramimonas_sp.AAC.1